MDKQDKIIENLRKCPHYDSCSQNFCPLDLDINLRSGSTQNKCRWMREVKVSKVANREFMSGGGVMPDAILNFVPRENLDSLNKASQVRWHEIRKNVLSENIKNEV